MTELLTAAQMRTIEEAAISSGAVTGLELMERAGQGVVEAILEEWPDFRNAPQSVSVLCGPGNNGGDGFVVARLLRERGWEVAVWFWGDADRLPADARSNHDRWATLGPIHPLELAVFREAQPKALYIDAVFGTGLTRPADGALGEMLAYLAGSCGDHGVYQPRMVAIDLPSGLCADSGKVLGCKDPNPLHALAPYARLTVTFETPKPGHFLAHGPEFCGKLVVKPIGLEQHRIMDPDRGISRPVKLQIVPALPGSEQELHNLSKPELTRKATGHKYDHGHVLVVTGGAGKTGAARLAARGALRMGAGLVTLACPPDALPEIAHHSTAVMCRSFADAQDLGMLLQDTRIDTVCLGPGLGTDPAADSVLQTVLDAAPVPENDTSDEQGRRLVLDADALTLMAQRSDPFAGLGEHCVLTPHQGEFARLFPDIAERYRATPDQGPAYSKVDAVRDAADASGATVLLKGPDTVVATRWGNAYVHAAAYDRAAPWLATAGSGDVLAGFIAGLLARGQTPAGAAILGARLHVDCARRFGPGLIAEDLPEALPSVFQEFGF